MTTMPNINHSIAQHNTPSHNNQEDTQINVNKQPTNQTNKETHTHIHNLRHGVFGAVHLEPHMASSMRATILLTIERAACACYGQVSRGCKPYINTHFGRYHFDFAGRLYTVTSQEPKMATQYIVGECRQGCFLHHLCATSARRCCRKSQIQRPAVSMRPLLQLRPTVVWAPTRATTRSSSPKCCPRDFKPFAGRVWVCVWRH